MFIDREWNTKIWVYRNDKVNYINIWSAIRTG